MARSMFKAYATMLLLASTAVLGSPVANKTSEEPKDAPDNIPDALLGSKEHHETFHGVKEHTDVPTEQPFMYKTQGINWINLAKVTMDKVMWRNIIDFPLGHRHTQVAAVAGVTDDGGRAISHAVGMMVLQPESSVCRFDLHSIDYFCLDAFHKPTWCQWGIATSQQQGFYNDTAARTEVYTYVPTETYRARMARAHIPDHMRFGLVFASMGRSLAETAEPKPGETASMTQDGLANRGVTLYVDNIHWASHHCRMDYNATVTSEFQGYLNQVLDPTKSGDVPLPTPAGTEVLYYDSVKIAAEAKAERERLRGEGHPKKAMSFSDAIIKHWTYDENEKWGGFW